MIMIENGSSKSKSFAVIFFSCVVQDGEAHRNALELLDALLVF